MAGAPYGGVQPQQASSSSSAEDTSPRTIAESTQSEEITSKTVAETTEKADPSTASPAGWVSTIGDSVMIGATDALQQEIPNLGLIDAQGSRQPPAAISVLRQRGAADQLGDLVVIHIGNNGPFTAEQFDEMMQMLASVRKVLIVNLTIPPAVEDPIAVPNNAVLADGVRRYPNTVLVDWRAQSAGHPEFLGEDGIHLTLQGAQAYAGLIAGYLGDPEEEGSVAPLGPLERSSWGESGSFGVCVGPSSWCGATATPRP